MFREKGTIIGGNYETKSKFYISQTNKEDKEKYKHDTIKPLEFVKNHIINSTKEGDIVLDCFNGSGSTGKAVMLENKRYNKNYKYIGIELTDEYLPIAKARIEYICDNKFDFWEDENKVEQRKVVDKNVSTIFDFLDK